MTARSIIRHLSPGLLAGLLMMAVQAQQSRPPGDALPPPELPPEGAPPRIGAGDDESGAPGGRTPEAGEDAEQSAGAGEPEAGTPARTSGPGRSTQFQESEGGRPAQLPPKVGGEQPPADVTIRRERDRMVEEYSVNGRVYMVRVVPDAGIPYYYLDTDGDGRLESRMDQRYLEPVKGPFYKIFEWK